MKKVKTIEIKDDKVKKYISLLQENGAKLYLVGGYVRDYLLGEVSLDLDIEVYNISFENLQKILGSEGEVQSNFGIVILKGTGVEFAIPRQENKIGIKHIDFEVNLDPYMDIKKAALRRDFTINSLMYDIENKIIIDNYNGIQDLKKKKIKHVSAKFSEDALRVLRAIRFSFKLGFTIEHSTVDLCLNLLEELKYVSPSRKNQELTKTFDTSVGNFKIGMKYVKEILLPYFKIEDMINTKQNPKYHPEGNVWEHTKQCMYLVNLGKDKYSSNEYKILMYTMFFHDIGKIYKTDKHLHSFGHEVKSKEMAQNILSDILINKKEKKLILNLIEDHMNMHNVFEMRPKTILNLFNKYKEDIYLLVQVGIIDSTSRLKDYSDENIIDQYNKISVSYNSFLDLYEKTKKEKQKYNGNYFMDLGYTGVAIKNKQEEHLIKFIKKLNK